MNRALLQVFDECHKAKNFVPGKEAQSTKVAATVLGLQARLPAARIVYCSATGISEVGNMAYMSRLVRCLHAHTICCTRLIQLLLRHTAV